MARPKLHVELVLDSAACVDDPWGEPARILEAVAKYVQEGRGPTRQAPMSLRDSNGNRIGAAWLTGKAVMS